MTRNIVETATPSLERRWRVPPPLLRGADAPGPEGLNVFAEHRSELGTVLWKSLRSVLLWAQVGPEGRKGLFPEGSYDRRMAEVVALDLNEELEAPLVVMASVLARPRSADPEAVGLACSRVGRWAERDDRRLTAIEFYQAASLACPSDGWYALQVGKAVRDDAEYSRAEAWLQRAVGLSRQARDWDTYIRAYIAMGKMMLRRGVLPAARRNLLKAYRRAVRQGLRDVEGMALHDLFVLEDESGNPGKGLEYAARAVRAYGDGHRLLPALAYDVAFLWLQQAQYTRALPVFRQVLPRVEGNHRTAALGAIAWGSGGVGDADSYEWARGELEGTLAGPNTAEAWVEVARGAGQLGRWEEAREAAHRAEALSRERAEGKVRFMAESVLESIAAEERAEAQLRETQAGAENEETARELAQELTRALRASPVASG